MSAKQAAGGDEPLVAKVTRYQLQHFSDADPRCRALQLPETLAGAAG